MTFLNLYFAYRLSSQITGFLEHLASYAKFIQVCGDNSVYMKGLQMAKPDFSALKLANFIHLASVLSQFLPMLILYCCQFLD